MNKDKNQVMHYQVWDQLLSWHRLSKLLTFIQTVLCLALFGTLLFVVRKPPALILVDAMGKTAYVEDYRTGPQAAKEPEMRYFVENFLSNYMAPNSAIIYYQMQNAMNAMTEVFQAIHLEDVKKNNTIEKIRLANIKTDLTIKKMEFQETGKHVYVDLLGIMEISPIDSLQSEPKRNGFKAKLKLERTTRTKEVPHGLLVDDFSNKAISLVTVEQGKDSQVKDFLKNE